MVSPATVSQFLHSKRPKAGRIIFFIRKCLLACAVDIIQDNFYGIVFTQVIH